jgi:NAD+ synthase
MQGMASNIDFSIDDLTIDCDVEIRRITSTLTDDVLSGLRKRGFVVGLSGGVDSSVVAALCVEAVGKDGVLGLLMPERESSSETLELSNLVAEHLGIQVVHTDITDILVAFGCYEARDRAIRREIPEYDSSYTCKLVLPGVLEGSAYRLYSVIVRSPDGHQVTKRLSRGAFMEIVAASNFKQRVRKTLEYHHADRLNYAVAGTPNRLEYDLGFFVKLGDGAADTKPIAHLYKTQVYQLAEHLEIPQVIRDRPPTTDTYSMPQSQEEFYFSLPYREMDLCLYGRDHGISVDRVAIATGLTADQVTRMYADIDAKRKASSYLHARAVLIERITQSHLRIPEGD